MTDWLYRLWFRATGGKRIAARKPRRVRIVCTDGTSCGTSIIDTLTGDKITDALAVTDIQLGVHAGFQTKATIRVEFFEVDSEVEPGNVTYESKHPMRGGFEAISSFTFADGLTVDVSSGVPCFHHKED